MVFKFYFDVFLEKFKSGIIYQYLLIALAFFLPLTVFGANLVIVIIVILWLFSGNYKAKYYEIMSNRLLIASIIFFGLHLVGLIWTEDIGWGLHIVHKMWYFLLLLPVLYTIVNKQYIKYYLAAFLLAITITEIFSYLIWFEVIKPFKMALVHNPTPFMSHVSYNPILTFAIYLVIHEVFLNKNLDKVKFFLYSFFAITMTFNMFITGGRAGQVMFFSMIAILIFQFFNSEKVKSLLAIFIILPALFFSAYHTSDLFNKRVNQVIENIQVYETNNMTDVGKRITFALNSWEIITSNPIIGVGTGDFPIEYKKISILNKNSEFPSPTNPHNMYTLVLVQLGFVGLISMLSIFYYQIKLSRQSSNPFIRDVGITLPLLFLVIMFSDSYLLGHYTTLLYVFFSSFLYKNFEKY